MQATVIQICASLSVNFVASDNLSYIRGLTTKHNTASDLSVYSRDQTHDINTLLKFLIMENHHALTGPMTQLLARVQDNTNKYLQFFSSQGLAEPSFSHGDGLSPG